MNAQGSTADHRDESVRTTLVRVLSPEHREFERHLLRAGTCLPLQHRIAWLEQFGSPEGWFCAARSSSGQFLAGFAIESSHSRALPGHRILRVERFCPPANVEVASALLDCIHELAQREARILRVRLELCCLAEARRVTSDALLARAGFVRSESPRSYEHTLVLDLQPDETALLMGFHSTARRHIRAVAKHPVEVRLITTPIWAERIEALLHESLSRTNGQAIRCDWSARIDFSRIAPSLMRIVGLFRTDVVGPNALVAFACACHHEEYAHYDASGATRSSGLRIPLAYALLWDLILWAKENHAQWFDFGGVTLGHADDADDALGGISDFKRYFTQNLVHVGSEWLLEPHPLRSRLAHAISFTAKRLRETRDH